MLLYIDKRVIPILLLEREFGSSLCSLGFSWGGVVVVVVHQLWLVLTARLHCPLLALALYVGYLGKPPPSAIYTYVQEAVRESLG